MAGVGTLASVTLSSCTLVSGTQNTGSSGAFPAKWNKPITIDVFDDVANYQGISSGWFAKIVEDKFNMKLNMIAPNVAGGGETLFNTRSSAGDLGDLLVLETNHLTQAVEGGLVAEASQYYKNMSSASKFDRAVKFQNKANKGVYAFPTSVSGLKPTQTTDALNPLFGAYMRWDLYEKIGTPKVGTFEDLLGVMQKMQKQEPAAPNGKKIYGLSLFKDWDSNAMQNAMQMGGLYGMGSQGLVSAAADGSKYEDILDPESHYVRSLKFFFEANKMGLVDPDSPSQNWSTLSTKYQNGQVLFSFWPFQGQSAYNTLDNMNAGRGFELIPIEDQKIFAFGAPAYGSGTTVLGIGAKAKDPQRVAAFIDWLYSSKGVYDNQADGAAGPKGITWQLDSSGKPELTAFGQKAFLGTGDTQVPAKWGGGIWSKGGSALNVTVVQNVDKDPGTGYPFDPQLWDSYQKLVQTPLSKSWSKQMDGATTTTEYLQKKGQYIVAPGDGYITPQDDSTIKTLRNQVQQVIVQNSWRMAMSTSDSDFSSLLKDMQNTAKGLGYDKVIAVDMKRAKEQNAQRVAVVKKFG
jgi:putative aldouronate transport system substrate-binding protein